MFDGIHIKKALVNLAPHLINQRIDKIYHPKEKLLFLKMKGKEKLLLSTEPDFCTLHLSTLTLENPVTPSTFCMVLRKHLEGGIITEISQEGYERLVHIHIKSFNELGRYTTKELHLELMGKYSNIILTEDNIIIDALHKYPIGVNGKREILPKRTYEKPPVLLKINSDQITEEQLASLLYEKGDTSINVVLQTHLEGFSKESINNLLEPLSLSYQLGETLGEVEIEKIYQALKALTTNLKKEDASYLQELDEEFNTYYMKKIMSGKVQSLHNIISKQLKKLRKKENIHLEKTLKEEEIETYKLKGDLLLANLYRLEGHGEKEVTVENYYDASLPTITIALDPRLSPSNNVQRYYKKYHKGKEGKRISLGLLEDVRTEIDYLESILLSLELAETLKDIQEISSELIDRGLIKENRKGKKKTKEEPLEIKKITIGDAYTIYVGKNNKQNDYITFKLAKNKDLWFHVKDYPGAHVLIKNHTSDAISEDIITLAAQEAATHSKGNTLSKVDVDYTEKQYVKKHPSHLLGKAFYTDYQTIRIDIKEK